MKNKKELSTFPLVTILTPVYNHELYLNEYFESIVNQSYSNIELILIDDASKDKSKEVIEQWMQRLVERFTNVIYINRPENKGLIANCNEGLHLARGKYLNLFASDDVMLFNNIEEKVKYLEEHPQYAMVHSRAYYFEKYKNVSLSRMNISSPYGVSGKVMDDLLINGCTIIAPTNLIRRDVLLEVGGFSDEYFMEDYPLWLKIANKYEIGFLNEPLVFYRITPGSMSREKDKFLKIVHSQRELLIHWNKVRKFDLSKALDNLNAMVAIWMLYNDRKSYSEYRKKIKDKKIKMYCYDIIYYLNIPNSIMEKLKKLVR